MKTVNFMKKALSICVKPIKWYFKTSAKNYEKLYGPDWGKYNIPVWM